MVPPGGGEDCADYRESVGLAARDRELELLRELKEVRKRKQPRQTLTEPQRRVIASRQGWTCAGCRCSLAEIAYDIDHIIALWAAGLDIDSNRQALCTACHRLKTDQERVARQPGLPFAYAVPVEPPGNQAACS